MPDYETLADQAVAALAAVSAIANGVENTHPERHAVRELKQNAENILSDAFRQARRLAYLASALSRDMRELEAQRAQAQEKD